MLTPTTTDLPYCGCNDDVCINMQSISEEADSEDGLDYYDTEDL